MGAVTFTDVYCQNQSVDMELLMLWQGYVAAAAEKYMGLWGLEPNREVHMRKEARTSIREASATLMKS